MTICLSASESLVIAECKMVFGTTGPRPAATVRIATERQRQG